MSLQSSRSDVARAEGAIADIEKKIAVETRKEADLRSKYASITAAMTGKLSPSSYASKARDLERVTSDLARVQAARADLQKRASTKRTDLHRYQERLSREEASERKKQDDAEKRRRRERETYETGLKSGLLAMRTAVPPLDLELNAAIPPEPSHDFFISHASEDKEDFVRPLADALKVRGAAVWYDEFSLRWGDSLRRAIDRGLGSSRYGVVILSEHFFKKEWPQRELDGLTEMEIGGKSRILPIWHKVSKDEVRRFSPSIADKLAMSTTTKSVEELADDLMMLIQSETSAGS